MSDEKKILLHACCGICSGYPIEHLRELGYEPVVYFYNPNLDSKEEFDKRLEAQKTLCEHLKCELISEVYTPCEYLNLVQTLENYEKEPEGGARWTLCFRLRLLKSAYKAKELGIRYFTTSMVISPHKNYKLITQTGKDIVRFMDDLEYVAIDFKKKDGFLKTNKLANGLGLYRQNYCGCKFSKR